MVLNYESHQNVARLQLQVWAFYIAMGKMLKTQFCLFECKVYRDYFTSGFNRCYVERVCKRPNHDKFQIIGIGK